MLNCEELEFLLMGVSLAASQISMSRHGNKSCCNSASNNRSAPDFTRSMKIQALNTSKYEYFIIIRAPPAGHRNELDLH